MSLKMLKFVCLIAPMQASECPFNWRLSDEQSDPKYNGSDAGLCGAECKRISIETMHVHKCCSSTAGVRAKCCMDNDPDCVELGPDAFMCPEKMTLITGAQDFYHLCDGLDGNCCQLKVDGDVEVHDCPAGLTSTPGADDCKIVKKSRRALSEKKCQVGYFSTDEQPDSKGDYDGALAGVCGGECHSSHCCQDFKHKDGSSRAVCCPGGDAPCTDLPAEKVMCPPELVLVVHAENFFSKSKCVGIGGNCCSQTKTGEGDIYDCPVGLSSTPDMGACKLKKSRRASSEPSVHV